VRVDLIRFGATSGATWSLGDVHSVTAPSPSACAGVLAAAARDTDAVLCWDAALGAPDPGLVRALLDAPAEVHHAGLALGTGGLPQVIDFVHPTWMLNADADPAIESSSWRMTWRACLVQSRVVQQLGDLDAAFATLDGAFLDLGYRWIRAGVFARHLPALVGTTRAVPIELPLHDELRFARRNFGAFWYRWAVGRGLVTGTWRADHLAADAVAAGSAAPLRRQPFQRSASPAPPVTRDARVTVLLPTIERYPYLRPLLDQLRQQTVRPAEIIVIDQTPVAARDTAIARDFADLPLKLLVLDEAGQCRSRNAGLRVATGDYVLFLDDDDEIQPTLIAEHLVSLARYRCDASCGVADELGAGPLPADFTFVRTSDVFPTGNSMIRRDLLRRTGLFDMAFDRMPRADADFGTRAYLAGAFLVLEPSIHVLHHRAPRGGLREHKARVHNYATSREALTVRHLPSPSEIYLAMRHQTPRRVRELLWQRAFGTLSGRGQPWRRLAKGVVGLGQLPDTVRAIRAAEARARAMLNEYPQIQTLA
jgi:GT2 family glycosyltransferase